MSPIVKSSKAAIRITNTTILLLALVTALCAACNGRSSQNQPVAEEAAAGHESSTGAEHTFPHPEHYADRLDDPERDAWQKPGKVVDMLACEARMVAADIGAGTGYFLPALSEAVGAKGTVLGLDIEPAMVERMTARIERDGLLNARAAIVQPNDPGLEPASVDRVLIVNTWHHIPERTAYAKKLLPALRPGGRLLIVDFTMESPHGPPPRMRLTVDTVRVELQAAGFATEVLEESLPYQYVVAAEVP